MARSRLITQGREKGRLQRPLGGKIAPKPDKVTVCLATPLHNFPDRESFLPERHFFMVPPRAASRCASAALLASGCCERNGFHLPGRFPSGTGPTKLIAAACMRSCVPRKPGAPRTHASVARPIAARRHIAIVTDDAAQQRPVCKFVAGRSAPSVQRRSNAFASFGQHHMPAPYDWLTRLRAARTGWSWHPLLALRRRTFFYPTRLSINH
jgi:hypothetical protein